MVQVAFAPNVDGLMGQLLVSEKLVTRDPVIEILVMAIEVVPRFVTVIVCGWLAVPLLCVPKLRLVGEKFITVPVPVRATVCGLLVALSVTVNVPVNAPLLVGANETSMVQVAPAVKLVGQLLVWLKGAVAAMLEIVTAEVPALVSVASCEVLVVPTVWVVKVIVAGEMETELLLAMPVRETLCGLLRAPSVIANVALRVPDPVAVIVTPITQEAPKAREEVQVLELMA
jgi:hypothetical protein